MASKIPVKSRLFSHPLVKNASITLNTNKGHTSEWNPMVSSGHGNAHIYVSPPLIPRALRIMDTIIKVLEKEGFETFSDNIMTVSKNDQSIELALIEKRQRIQDERFSYDYTNLVPTGKLSIRAKSAFDIKEYVDTPFKSLEEKLDPVLEYFIKRIEELRVRQIELEAGWEKQRIAREIEKAKKERVQQEYTDFSMLMESSTKLKIANEIRTYIAKRVNFESDPNDCDLLEWIKWANQKADWIDPLIECEDEYLSDKDKKAICDGKEIKPTTSW